MKNTYQITGMSCNGCVKHVEQALSKAEGIGNVTVDLQKAQAEIDMQSNIPLETLQEILNRSGGNYHITVSTEGHSPS